MTKINVDKSWQPMEVTIKGANGLVATTKLDEVELDLYGGKDGQEFSIKGRTVI